jgi:hypothetical protein
MIYVSERTHLLLFWRYLVRISSVKQKENYSNKWNSSLQKRVSHFSATSFTALNYVPDFNSSSVSRSGHLTLGNQSAVHNGWMVPRAGMVIVAERKIPAIVRNRCSVVQSVASHSTPHDLAMFCRGNISSFSQTLSVGFSVDS